MSEPVKVNAHEMRRRIGIKYGKVTDGIKMPEHLVMFEVQIDGRPRWEGGPVARQRIDAVAVGIWKKTQHLVHGFEIKVSRADLLAELRDPTKAAASVRLCDRWWLALGSPDLLRDSDDVPDGWGILAASGRGLRTIIRADPQPGERDNRIWAGIVQASLRSHGACRGLGHVAGFRAGQEWADRARRTKAETEAFWLRHEVNRLRERLGEPSLEVEHATG
jgi:hypothetical protein